MATPSRSFVVIVAATAGSLGIGRNGTLPWRLAGDMAYFKRVTATTISPGKVNAVIMGRKTWESIPVRFRPLKGRQNIVLSRNPAVKEDLLLPDDVLVARSLDEALALLSHAPLAGGVDRVFIIGGRSVYAEAVTSELCEKVFLTSVKAQDGRFDDCDVHFPSLAPDIYKLARKGELHEEGDVTYSFDEYIRSPKAVAGTSSQHDGDNEITAKPDRLPNGSGDHAADSVDQGSKNEGNQGLGAGGTHVHSAPKTVSNGNGEYGARTHEARVNGGESVIDAVTPRVRDTEDDGHEGNDEEMQYLKLIEDILDKGVERGDRTGTGTLSKFGVQMRFSLREGRFPLLTTKRVFWRGVAEELLWFISGCTNANMLKEKGIHIWDGNGSREFLDGLGLLDREEGDLGPVYGFQWRHFGAEYIDMHTDYTGKGVDQLKECIDKIKNRPEDRRIILSAWNPTDLGKMALPPCHMFCQFYVSKGELTCQMYQRSADMGLGVPFNIASYALLTCLMAQVCGLKPGEFVHTIGDAHVYLNHVDALREQLRRKPRPFPTLEIDPTKTDIDSFKFADFEVKGYRPHKSIQMKMAV